MQQRRHGARGKRRRTRAERVSAGKSASKVQALDARVKVLQRVCSEAYQLAGTVGAPVEALDNLSAAANGEPIPHETFLPIRLEDCEECAPRAQEPDRSETEPASDTTS